MGYNWPRCEKVSRVTGSNTRTPNILLVDGPGKGFFYLTRYDKHCLWRFKAGPVTLYAFAHRSGGQPPPPSSEEPFSAKEEKASQAPFPT